MVNLRFVVGRLSVGVIVFGAAVASAETYPNKPIRIVTAAAGAGNDFQARIIAQGISGPLGQPVIVENRTGILAAEVVRKAPPDGYTLNISGTSLWILPLLQKMPYDPVRDYAAIVQIAREGFVVAVHPSVSASSIKELIALAKAKPGELNYASAAIGSSSHLAAELFKHMAGVKIVWVPYKGTAAAITALISGEVQMAISDAGLVAPHAKSGKLRWLAVTSAKPSALAPGLPTVADSGLPGYESVSITGIWAPAKTPGAVIGRLNQEIVRVLNLSDVKHRFVDAGLEVVGSSPEQLVAAVKVDMRTISKVIKDAGIKLD